MGYSDYRLQELKGRLTAMQPSPTAVEMGVIGTAVDEYCKARDEQLTVVRALVGDTSPDTRLSQVLDAFSRWNDAMKRFSDCLASVSDPSLPALAFVTKAAQEEKLTVESIANARVGESRDVIAILGRRLEEKIAALADKWARLNGDSGYFDAQEQRATESMKQMMADAINRTRAASDQLLRLGQLAYDEGQLLAKGINKFFTDLAKGESKEEKVYKAIIAIANPGGWFKGQITGMVGIPSLSPHANASQVAELTKGLEMQVNGLFQQRVSEYQDAIRRRADGVLVLFTETRRDTDEFIRANGFDVAKARYQTASDLLSAWVSSLPTDAQKSDMGAFAKAILEMYSRHLSEIETVFNRFVKENQGRFFGPIGPDISEALTKTRAWEEARVGMVSLGVEEKLRAFRSDANQFIEVTIPTAIKEIEASLALLDPVQRESIQTEYQAFRDEVMRQTRERVREIDQLCGKAEQMFRSDTLTAYLDRRILTDKVR